MPANGAAITLAPLGLGPEGHGWSEAEVQALIQAHPACLPIAEIDPLFADPVPVCTELNTLAGPMDNFLVTATGLPVLVECKLWRNPQARREVVGQILDYAKELSRWSSSDLQREVRRRLAVDGDPVLEAVRAKGHVVNEIDFNDALTLNLRRGRFLLLIVGDGIREGVEAIAEYLQVHAGLHFTLGLVELPIFAMPDGGRLVAPRVVARTQLVQRTVVTVPDGLTVLDSQEEDAASSTKLISSALSGRHVQRASAAEFWDEFLSELTLDDPEQPMPLPSKGGHIVFKFGAPGGSSWLTVFRSKADNRIGLFLSGNKDSVGQAAARALVEHERALRRELGSDTLIDFAQEYDNGFPRIYDGMSVESLDDEQDRTFAFEFLRRRTNDFVNALRPRIRAALDDLA